MKLNFVWGHTCQDYGQMDGRPRNAVEGCAIYGRLSRWPIDSTGIITGPEEVLLDTQGNNRACVQFATHSTPASVVKGTDDYFYISFGDGAAFTTVDPGDLGNNPCADTPPYTGAFRSQDPNRYNGKTLRLDPVNFTPEIVTTGHRNPFRLTVAFGNVYATETGWYTHEEFNLIRPGLNLGWPCMEGDVPTPEYGDLATCIQLRNAGVTFTPPTYQYEHPQVVAPMVTSISGLAGWNDRFYIGDFAAGWIKSINQNAEPASETLHMRDVYPVELKVTEDNVLIYVDHTKGSISAVTVPGNVGGTLDAIGIASPSPLPIPLATIIPVEDTFNPFVGQVTFGSESNIAGREGANYEWTVVLLQNCGTEGPAQTCDWTWLFQSTIGSSLTFNAPYIPEGTSGAVEVTLTVNTGLGETMGYAPARATYYMQSNQNDGRICTCGGARRNINAPPPPTGVVWQEDTTDNGGTAGFGPANLLAPPNPGSVMDAPVPDGYQQIANARVYAPFVAAWSPLATEPLVFITTSPLDETMDANYTWNIYAYSNCLRNTCGWTHLVTVSNGYGRVLYLDAPTIRIPPNSTGITLGVDVWITSPDGRISQGRGSLPSIGAASSCICTGNENTNAYMITLTGASLPDPAGSYTYKGTVVQAMAVPSASPSVSPSPSTTSVIDNSNVAPSSSSSNGIDIHSAAFIGGIVGAVVGLTILVMGGIFTVLYNRRRQATNRTITTAEGELHHRPANNNAGNSTSTPAVPLSARRGIETPSLNIVSKSTVIPNTTGSAAPRGLFSPPGTSGLTRDNNTSPQGNKKV